MKKIYYLFIVGFLFFMIGCSEDNLLEQERSVREKGTFTDERDGAVTQYLQKQHPHLPLLLLILLVQTLLLHLN